MKEISEVPLPGLCVGLIVGGFVTIGEDIKIFIHELKGHQIWLRIVAPKDSKILRDKHHHDNPRRYIANVWRKDA